MNITTSASRSDGSEIDRIARNVAQKLWEPQTRAALVAMVAAGRKVTPEKLGEQIASTVNMSAPLNAESNEIVTGNDHANEFEKLGAEIAATVNAKNDDTLTTPTPEQLAIAIAQHANGGQR